MCLSDSLCLNILKHVTFVWTAADFGFIFVKFVGNFLCHLCNFLLNLEVIKLHSGIVVILANLFIVVQKSCYFGSEMA